MRRNVFEGVPLRSTPKLAGQMLLSENCDYLSISGRDHHDTFETAFLSRQDESRNVSAAQEIEPDPVLLNRQTVAKH